MDTLLTEPWLLHPAVALFGLLVGSFLNVVILRLPRRLQHEWQLQAHEVLETGQQPAAAPPDLVFSRSACPRCQRQLGALENVPLLSFLLQRGRCRGCGAPISWQYPVVEALTAVLAVLVVQRFGIEWQTLVALLATFMLIAAAGIDVRTQLLPDQLTLPLLWLGLLAAVAGWFQTPAAAIVGAAVGYLSLWSVYWAFKLLTGKEGMGYGDFKLLGALGAFCGAGGILPIVLVASAFGAVIGAAWLALRGRDRATPVPFGPFLAAAGWVQLVWGEALMARYFALYGP